MTDELWGLVRGFVIGVVAGALYFGGLWLTVRKIGATRNPERRLLISFIVRMGLLLTVFYGLANRGWPVLAAAMLGLLVARQFWLSVKGRKRPTTRG